MPYAAMPMEFDAFISYANADKTAADAACAVLEAAGIRCWVAPRDISPGREYAAAIIDAIDRCRVMVLIFSSSANVSPQVRREIERAASKGVAIMPVRIEKVVPTKSMEYFLGDIHWLDAMTPPIEDHLQQLAISIKALLNANSAAAGETSAPDSRRQTGRVTPIYSAAQMPDGAYRYAPKYPAGKNWLLPVIGGVVGVSLLFGAWLYQNGTLKPIPSPNVPSQPSEAKPEPKKAELLVPELVPFISDHDRATIRNTYLPAADHKALAISLLRIGFTSGQSNDDAAWAGALDNCRQATDAAGHKDFRCDLYALGNTVVYTGVHPPLPPEPWLVPNTSVERPYDPMNVPLVADRYKTTRAKDYGGAAKSKAFALSPTGASSYVTGNSSPEEAIRRVLEWCGRFGVPCMIVAVDDRFVVAVPTTMKVTGFFQANTNDLILPELRSDVTRRLGNITTGWNAVAVGTGGIPGLTLGTLSEQAAIDGALANCSTRDRNCRVIAIGPFLVEPTPASTPTTGNAPQTPSAPSNVASALAPTLPPTGDTAQNPAAPLPGGWIGVGIQSVTDDIAERLNIKPPRGALVTRVDENGPAKLGGIQVGDVLLKFDGQDIKEMHDLPRMVTGRAIGQQVEIFLNRGGNEEAHTVRIGRRNGSE
jgi:TIR domain/PDZ domain